MMEYENILLKNVTVKDRHSPFHDQQVDILIRHGYITNMGKISAPQDVYVMDQPGIYVSPGWVDIGAFNGEPGFEQRENLNSLLRAATLGGYTHIAPQPVTNPPIDNKSQLQFLIQKNAASTCQILPLASATVACNGTELSEIRDLIAAGATALTNGLDTRMNQAMLLRVFQYMEGLKTVYIHQLPHHHIAPEGQINEGLKSIEWGVEGIPQIEENLSVQEALALAQYTSDDIRIMNISTASALNLIGQSKMKSYIQVPYLNLCLDDSNITPFDTQSKVLPPLRDKKDRKALLRAVKKGTVQCIGSNHVPHLLDDKDCEFGLAEFGSIGLETCFGALSTHTDLSVDEIIHALSYGPREYLKLDTITIDKDHVACLTLFDPTLSWKVTKEALGSLSQNTPFMNQRLTGRAIGIINGSKIEIHSNR